MQMMIIINLLVFIFHIQLVVFIDPSLVMFCCVLCVYYLLVCRKIFTVFKYLFFCEIRLAPT
jgi:hypothetical protein